jgi:hypothetical protein
MLLKDMNLLIEMNLMYAAVQKSGILIICPQRTLRPVSKTTQILLEGNHA